MTLEQQMKEFEEWLTRHPHLQGGNNFQVITEQYGIALSKPEYCSSWMQGTFEAYLDLIKELK